MTNLSITTDQTVTSVSQNAGRNDEETLVVNDRSALSPSQIVEQKLIGRLKSSPVLVSHVQQQLKPRCR